MSFRAQWASLLYFLKLVHLSVGCVGVPIIPFRPETGNFNGLKRNCLATCKLQFPRQGSYDYQDLYLRPGFFAFVNSGFLKFTYYIYALHFANGFLGKLGIIYPSRLAGERIWLCRGARSFDGKQVRILLGFSILEGKQRTFFFVYGAFTFSLTNYMGRA